MQKWIMRISYSSPRQNKRQQSFAYGISRKTKKVIGLEKYCLLSVVHAMSGCDTTSRVFGIEKSSALKKLKSKHFVEQANTFLNKEATTKEIKGAGENLLVVLYNGREGERLDTLRYQRFCDKVSSSSQVVEVQALPPTSSAAEAHSTRVFLQVQDRMGRVDQMVPEEWGWTLQNGRLFPDTTPFPPAPERLLHVVRCSCKTNYDSERCSCHKHRLECSVSCGHCRGVNCSNSGQAQEIEDLLDDSC